MRTKQSGFTLLELMITLIILGLMLGMGVPAMTQMIQSSNVSRVTNFLVRDFNLARSQAVDLNQTVTLCRRVTASTCHSGGAGNGANWQTSGWLVFTDPDNDRTPNSADNVLRDTAPLNNVVITHNSTAGATFNAAFSFRPDGTIRDSNKKTASVSMTVCPPSDDVRGRQLYITERGDIRTRVADSGDC